MQTTQDTSDNDQPPENDRPPRSKVRLTFTIALFLVLVLVLVAIFTPLRDIVINRLTVVPSPTPTATLAPGDDMIDIHASPPGTVTVDGHTITLNTQQGYPYSEAKAIHLSRGMHRIIWQAPPFLSRTCIISVPPLASELCNYKSSNNPTDPSATRLITFNASLADLPGAQQTAMKQAIQGALNTLQSTATVQPGEHYLYAQSNSNATEKVATQPLNATLSLHLDADQASQKACSNYGDTCTFEGQNCLQLCSSPYGVPIKGVQLSWNVIALFYPTWTYTTQSGQVVAQNQPDTNDLVAGEDHSIPLSLTWDGTKWHASIKTFPESVSQQFSSSPACDSITNQIGTSSQYSTTSNGKKVGWGFAAGTNEAQGCLAIVVPAPSSQQDAPNFKQPAAYFLYRFGSLLAVNPLAHSEFPGIPMANAYEQGIAQGFVAKLQF